MSASRQSEVSSHQVLPLETLQPVMSSVRGAKVEDPMSSHCSSSFPHPVSQSVEPRSKDDRLSTVSLQCHAHVRSDILLNLLYPFICWTSYAARPRSNPRRLSSRRMLCFPTLARRRKSDTCPYSQPCSPRLAVSSCCWLSTPPTSSTTPSRRCPRWRRSLAGSYKYSHFRLPIFYDH